MRSWTLRPCHRNACRTRHWKPACPYSPRLFILGSARECPRTPHITHRRWQSSISDNDSLVQAADRDFYNNSLGEVQIRQQAPTNTGSEVEKLLGRLDELLPDNLNEAHYPNEGIGKPGAIRRLLAQSYRETKVDLLSYLGLRQQRWDAVTWVACTVIDSPDTDTRPYELPNIFGSVVWPQRSLDEITQVKVRRREIESEKVAEYRPLASVTVRGREYVTELPLSAATMRNRKGRMRVEKRKLLGHLWISLGTMVLAAAERSLHDATQILSTVAFVLSRFHERGYLPDDVLQQPLNTDPMALSQHPLVAQMSANFLEIDKPGGSIEAGTLVRYTGQYLRTQLDKSFDNLRTRIEEHGSEHWLEYILWCCVHGGWLVEGATIVDDMQKRSGIDRWSLMCWRRLTTEGGYTQSLQMSGPPASAQTQAAVTRSVSTEAVVALVDGLAASLWLKPDPSDLGTSTASIMEQIYLLHQVLERDNMSLGVTTWDAFIVRALSSPAFERIEDTPLLFEKTLSLTQTYGSEATTKNAFYLQDDTDLSSLSAYILDGSAAIIGFYHRALTTHARARDVSGALRTLGALQALTDANKRKSMEDFVSELRSTADSENPAVPLEALEGPTTPLASDAAFPGVDFPGYSPNLPPKLLAELVDLFSDSNDIDLVRWMVSSDEIDGPLIPERLYGDRYIAPALIRYASAVLDEDLLRKVTRVQTSIVAGQTLVALCESKLRAGEVDDAAGILELIRTYTSHEWNALDFCSILRALLLQGHQGSTADTTLEWSEGAQSFFQRLLRGDLSQVWGPSFKQLDTIVAIFAGLDHQLAAMCSNLLPRDGLYEAELPTPAFDAILGAAVKIWGSEKGMELWHSWCNDKSERRPTTIVGPSREEIPRLRPRASAAELFSKTAPLKTKNNAEGDNHGEGRSSLFIEGGVVPTIATLRVIVQQALLEHRNAPAADQSPKSIAKARKSARAGKSHHAVLRWAVGTFRDFGLSDADIDYNLQGYLSGERIKKAARMSYSDETLRIWRVFTGWRKKWALHAEQALRSLASTDSRRMLVYDDQPFTERSLLLSLAKDMGLEGTTRGEDLEQTVVITKGESNVAPKQIVDEVLAEKGQ